VAVRGGGAGGIASAEDPAYLGSGVVWVDATDLGNNRVQLDSMAMKGSGGDKTSKFHFDTNLRKLDLPWNVPDDYMADSTEVELVAWSKIDFPVKEYSRDRRDPLALLNVGKADLPSPAEAWQGQSLRARARGPGIHRGPSARCVSARSRVLPQLA